MIRSLGHRVDITHDLKNPSVGEKADVLVLMHANKCAPAARNYRGRHPQRPLIVALTGTDLYRGLARDAGGGRSLELADRIVMLQRSGLTELTSSIRRKCHVIHQSSVPIETPKYSSTRALRVCVVGHLRAVKDPMRCAMAVRDLPQSSKIQVDHMGKAITSAFKKAATRETRENPRYRWLGEHPHWRARQLIARSHLLVLTSRMEGGANVVSEACVAGTPVLTSKIDGSIGLLGKNHPGMFETGDTNALQELLMRFEGDEKFREKLRLASVRKASLFTPDKERARWSRILRGF